MKLSFLITTLAAIPAITAIPTPKAGSNAWISRLSAELTPILSALGISFQNNGGSHGASWSWKNLTFPKVLLSNTRYSHNLPWPTHVNYVDWKTYKANGVNLGGWLEVEQVIDPTWWNQHAPDATDEWTFCQTLGSKCGPVLEKRYASYITTADIDKFASVGVNTLRIPTTYAAWIQFPGTEFYHGNQQGYLRTITNYAITKYGMHIIIGLHSLPGGVNTLDIGEAFGHDAWFFNTTNLEYSFKAVDAILSFITSSGKPGAFTLAPINEASDNFAGFGSAAGLTTNGTNWINTYIQGCLAKIKKVNSRIPLMLQDCFQGEEFWSPFYSSSTNLVIDSHIYYFAAAGTYSQYVAPAICGQGSAAKGDSKFPVFIGEWSLQVEYNNTFAERKTLFDTQRYAWATYVQGGAFWTGKFLGDVAVDGEGTQGDYWDYDGLIDAGVITSATTSAYC